MRQSHQRFHEFSVKKYKHAGDSDDFASNETVVEKTVQSSPSSRQVYIVKALKSESGILDHIQAEN